MKIEKIRLEKGGKTRIVADIPKIVCREHPSKAERIGGLYEKYLIRRLEILAKKLGGGELFCDFSTEISGDFLSFIFTVRYGKSSFEFADSYRSLEPFELNKADRAALAARASNIVARRIRLGEPMYDGAEITASKKLSAALMIPYENEVKLIYPAGLLAPKKTVTVIPIKL